MSIESIQNKSIALKVNGKPRRLTVPTHMILLQMLKEKLFLTGAKEGGGIGGKAGIHIEALVYCLSQAAGHRPVKLSMTREESLFTMPGRRRAPHDFGTRRDRQRPAGCPGDLHARAALDPRTGLFCSEGTH